MAIEDLWRLRDGSPSKRDGRGLRWRVRVVGYPATAHRTKTEAERINAQRITAGPPRPASALTVGECVDQWLGGKRHLSPKGLEAATLAAGYVRERWGPVLVDQVQCSPGAVQMWMSGLRTPRGPASASLRHKVLQCLAGSLHGRVDLSGVRVGREVRRDARFLTVAQLQALAAACHSYEAMILLLGTTGLRIGECCALDVGDVDVTRGRLRVRRSKTGRGRDIPVPASVLALLDLDRGDGEPLFVTSRGGRVDKDHWRARHWRRARDVLGVQGLRVHDLRHTAASLAIAVGADAKTVQRMLGHASAAMTLDLYAGLFDRSLDDVATRMDAALGVPDAYR